MTLIESENYNKIWYLNGIWNNKCLKCDKIRTYSNKWNSYIGTKKLCITCCNRKSRLTLNTNEIEKSDIDNKIWYLNGIWNNKCLKCDRIRGYVTKRNAFLGMTKICISCSKSGHKISEETRHKMSNAHIGIKLSKQTKEKLSIQKIGNKNPRFGKIPSEKHRENMRIAAINRLKLQGIMIAFNPSACQFMDNFGIKYGYNFQHALNGGEVNLHGFLMDGYDKEKNIIFEYDEPAHHYKRIREKDIYKQKIIIEKICPTMFFRYDEKNNRLYDVISGLNIAL